MHFKFATGDQMISLGVINYRVSKLEPISRPTSLVV